MRLHSRSPEASRAAARALARSLDERGLLLALVGPLGAGKTLFVKGLAEGLGIDPARVASPSFVIASEYKAASGMRLAHVDLYRVESVAELETTGFLDLLEPGALVAVEWADRFPEALPGDRLELHLERPLRGAEDAQRVLNAQGLGVVSSDVLARWREALGDLPELDPE